MQARLSTSFFLFLSIIFFSGSRAQAAFDVSMWNLRTSVISFFHPPGEQDVDRITAISNPLMATTISSVNDGADWSRAQYDYAWNGPAGTGHFNTTLSQAIHTADTINVCAGEVFIQTTTDLMVQIDSRLSYSHTPGEEPFVFFSYNIWDQQSGHLPFDRGFQGGTGASEPPIGTFEAHGEALLFAGRTYRLAYNLNVIGDTDPPAGILVTSGFLNFTITPEPAMLALLLPAAGVLLRRRRPNL